jgi:hypothetical protein
MGLWTHRRPRAPGSCRSSRRSRREGSVRRAASGAKDQGSISSGFFRQKKQQNLGRKIWREKMAFLLKLLQVFAKLSIITLVFEKNANFVRRKLAKTAEIVTP